MRLRIISSKNLNLYRSILLRVLCVCASYQNVLLTLQKDFDTLKAEFAKESQQYQTTTAA